MSEKTRKPASKPAARKPAARKPAARKAAKAGAPAAPSAHVQTLSLLWGPQDREGRSGLSVRSIVAAAVDIADKSGLVAASMRQVAEALGVGTMSIYTHVPGKTELTALMFDSVYNQLYADIDEPSRQPGWRAALELIAQRNWQIFTRHPWMLGLYAGRLSLGPHTMIKYEAELRPLDGIGLDDVEMDSVLTLVTTHVAGTAQVRYDLQRAAEESGMSDKDWWLEAEPVLHRLMAGMHFPVGWRVGQAAGEAHQAVADPEHMLQFGLERILDGVGLLIEARAEKKRQKRSKV